MSGADRYLSNFLDLAIRERPQHEFFLYGNEDSYINYSGKNVIIKRIHEWNTQWFDQVVLAKQTKKDNLDVFFSPFDKAPLFSSCPTVITIHDMHFFLLHSAKNYIYKLLFNFLYLRLKNKPIARRAKTIISVSHYTKSEIVRLLKVRESKVIVIHNGISNIFKPVEDKSKIEKLKKEHNIKRKYLLYVGSFMPHKNVKSLVLSYKQLRDAIKEEYQLVLCGKKDSDYLNIYEVIKELDLNNNVVFIDFVSNRDLPALYSGAEIFVCPSLYEGFGLPPLEAMACGTPVISSNATALPEVIDDAGMLVDAKNPYGIKDAIEKLLDNPEILNDLKRKGMERSQKFSLDKTSKKILEIIENL